MTRDEFKRKWESDTKGGGITFDDIANCAISWGLTSNPRTKQMTKVRYMVLCAAGTTDAEYFKPEEQ